MSESSDSAILKIQLNVSFQNRGLMRWNGMGLVVAVYMMSLPRWAQFRLWLASLRYTPSFFDISENSHLPRVATGRKVNRREKNSSLTLIYFPLDLFSATNFEMLLVRTPFRSPFLRYASIASRENSLCVFANNFHKHWYHVLCSWSSCVIHS